MTQTLALEARDKAGNYYRQGFNCAESVLMAGRELLAPELSPEIVKLATPLGGGLGRAGCVCGALNASIMALGMIQGRTDSSTDRRETSQHAAKIYELFVQKFGSPCCRELNHHEYDNDVHYRRCLKIVGGTAQILIEYLANENLLPVRLREIK